MKKEKIIQIGKIVYLLLTVVLLFLVFVMHMTTIPQIGMLCILACNIIYKIYQHQKKTE